MPEQGSEGMKYETLCRSTETDFCILWLIMSEKFSEKWSKGLVAISPAKDVVTQPVGKIDPACLTALFTPISRTAFARNLYYDMEETIIERFVPRNLHGPSQDINRNAVDSN